MRLHGSIFAWFFRFLLLDQDILGDSDRMITSVFHAHGPQIRFGRELTPEEFKVAKAAVREAFPNDIFIADQFYVDDSKAIGLYLLPERLSKPLKQLFFLKDFRRMMMAPALSEALHDNTNHFGLSTYELYKNVREPEEFAQQMNEVYSRPNDEKGYRAFGATAITGSQDVVVKSFIPWKEADLLCKKVVQLHRILLGFWRPQ
jgi:hypothetical protein